MLKTSDIGKVFRSLLFQEKQPSKEGLEYLEGLRVIYRSGKQYRIHPKVLETLLKNAIAKKGDAAIGRMVSFTNFEI